MKINWVTGGGAGMVDAVFKVCASRALLPAGYKCCLSKDNTFLIALESSAIVAVLFVSGASCTRCQGSVT